MATSAVISCRACKKKFEMFWEQSPGRPFCCPYCGTVMDKEMSERTFKVLAEVLELNQDFVRYHSDREEPLFEVSFKYVPASKK